MADVLDVNIGFSGVDDVKLLPDTAITIQNRFNNSLCNKIMKYEKKHDRMEKRH